MPTTPTTRRSSPHRCPVECYVFITGWHYLVPPEAIKGIKEADITVDTIGFGEHFAVNFDALEEIATGTGGQHRVVTKPSQGTTNTPAVTERSISDILEGAVADNTATLFLLDYSDSLRRTMVGRMGQSNPIRLHRLHADRRGVERCGDEGR